MRVSVTREPFSDYFNITLATGHSEELETEETKQWFKDHGANMDVVDKALDHCWNFGSCEINIADFRLPRSKLHAHAPKLD